MWCQKPVTKSSQKRRSHRHDCTLEVRHEQGRLPNPAEPSSHTGEPLARRDCGHRRADHRAQQDILRDVEADEQGVQHPWLGAARP